ncbi:SDR family NAD(P)-dependent oxidoreductase [Actinoplanes sp. CA-030573]|uniref:SDR family NAD(P)-dependent oxidoreductase n=1 Tax=Actinoplanes sp. CA-030573 TaxID=3239898 RepID=UPI003D94313D
MTNRYGPWAVVTGASSGIGREFAYQLAGAGLNVVLVARRRSVLDDIAHDLTDRYTIDCRVVDADLACSAGTDNVIAASTDLDIGLVVAAAGYGTSGAFLNGDLATELAMIQVNCSAVMKLTHHFSTRFVHREHAGIILLSSVLGYQGVPRAATYAATKAWVQALAEGLHGELNPLGIDVLSVAPGPVHTGFAAYAGMTMGKAQRPTSVVAPALKALGRSITLAPGLPSKILTSSLAPLPRKTRTMIMSWIMAAMTPQPGAEPPSLAVMSGDVGRGSATTRSEDRGLIW